MALPERATAWDYNILEMHMELKHKECGRLACLHGWGDKKDEPWIELYFADKEPADKNGDRNDCHGWRRMEMWLKLDGTPLYTKPEPRDPETDEHNAKKKAKIELPKPGDAAASTAKQIPQTPPKQGDAAATTKAMELSEMQDTQSLDDEVIEIPNAPANGAKTD